jgi:hypothetical protein
MLQPREKKRQGAGVFRVFTEVEYLNPADVVRGERLFGQGERSGVQWNQISPYPHSIPLAIASGSLREGSYLAVRTIVGLKPLGASARQILISVDSHGQCQDGETQQGDEPTQCPQNSAAQAVK